MYVGITVNPKKRKTEHRTKKPKHSFFLIEEHDDQISASEMEKRYIQEYNTYEDFSKWNKTPGGDYLAGNKKPGVGGAKKGVIPWNKGLTSRDERVANNIKLTATKNRENGHYLTCSQYLPKLFGDKNHMKQECHRKKMSDLAKRRYRVYKEDGSWTWGYHPPSVN